MGNYRGQSKGQEQGGAESPSVATHSADRSWRIARRWNLGYGGHSARQEGVRTMSGSVINEMYRPFYGGEHPISEGSAIRDEISWARNHALRWAEQVELSDEEADAFAEFFTEGWIDHLKNNAEQINRDFQKMLEIFREEKGHGN
jgi:hypothetical protein